jgi:catechol 2,3-dioxygenase-like lactoylglutathione lyase family enzyme
MKLRHVSITTRDADRLADFYSTVFGYGQRGPPRTLSGERVWRGNGLAGIDIYSIWLSQPGAEGAFLELLQYDRLLNRQTPAVNEPGYGHIAFQVEDIDASYAAILECGGTALGEITDLGTAKAPYRIVYMRDPDGNILEIEQG